MEKKRLVVRISALVLVLCLLASVALAEAAAFDGLDAEIFRINKYGNIILNVYGSDALEMGLDFGDVVDVTINGETFTVPVGSEYSDVDQGERVCRIAYDPNGEENSVILAISHGDLATALGVAEKQAIEAEPGYEWVWTVETPVSVRIDMAEKGGYEAEYLLRKLTRSNERADYPGLTDEQYANFRVISTTGMGKGMLCRSTSPIDPELNRNREADAALADAGVRTVVNLADNDATMTAHEGYQGSHYAECDVIALNLGLDLLSDEMNSGMAAAVRFMNEHDGPYLLHCKEGKDRTGFFAMVFECLMGAAAEEVCEDYMETYVNCFGVEKGSEQYERILESNIIKNMSKAFDIEEPLAEADLSVCATEYLKSCGLTEEEITTLKGKLAGA